MKIKENKDIKTNVIDTAKESNTLNLDFSKKGLQDLKDAIVDFGALQKLNKRLSSKAGILRAIEDGKYNELRDISNFFFRTSGIYSRLCRYMAYLYRYDWFVTPFINEVTNENKKEKNEEKALQDFHRVLNTLDNFEVKRFFGEVALKVIRNGCYYGYLIPSEDTVVVQELPVNYCRSRFTIGKRPAVEFNMKFFDDFYKDANQRIKILNLFPVEFKKGYIAYKEGKLVPQFQGDTPSWYLLEPNNTVKFNINGEDYPAFISVIPAIIDLDTAKEVDQKKMAQELLKIIIQKMPIDKNGDLVFDVDEAAQLHNNAVNMLGKAIGIDVLTTFADVDVADMSNNRSTAATDDLERVERAIYNEAGVSQMQFNTDGNIALEKSILNDEAALYNLIVQFEAFLNQIIERFNKQPKKYYFRVQLLTTTIYNYKEMSKLYKEQMQVGFSKMLPQIALGHSQSTILANAYFENDILDLVHLFIPPLMSSTMNADAIDKVTDGDPKGGRPTKESQGESVSEKTIQNKESQS